MQVMALANQKGGCGKTTTAINLAASLAALQQRVLLIDLDPQAHATLGLGQRCTAGHGVAPVLEGLRRLEEELVRAPGDFDLLPGSLELARFEQSGESRLQPEQQLVRALRPLEARYDFCLIDCPPRADGLLSANAVRASDAVLLVVETGAFALQGALRARELFAEIAASMAQRVELWVVATLFDRRTKFARELLVALQARFAEAMFETAIRSHVRLREAAAFGLPVRELDRNSRAVADFDALAREVLERARDRALDLARRARLDAEQERTAGSAAGLLRTIVEAPPGTH